jgi:hypothetical protein
MIVWYVLLTIISGQPQVKSYADEKLACTEYFAEKAVGPAFIFQASGKKDNPVTVPADCKPVYQVVLPK